MVETTKSRQDSEYLVLTSIYSEDVRDLRKGNKWKPLDLIISLKPQQGGSITTCDIHASVDLHVTCSNDYPDRIPELALINSKGLSSSLLEQLHVELSSLAKKLRGTEMIFELCQYVQEFLHKHNKPLAKSFYEEMLQRREKEEKQNERAKKLEEDRQRTSLVEEINRIYSRKEEANKLRNERKNSTQSISSNDLCSHKFVEEITFDNNGAVRKILRGKCLKHFDERHTIYNGIDKETGETFIVYEWKVEIDKFEALNKQLAYVEQEFSYLTKLRQRNLALYQNFTYRIENDHFIVQILTEFVMGLSCKTLFTKCELNAEISHVKTIAKGVLQALDYLHKKNVIHRDIRDSYVFINNKGIVKLSNYSIHKRLSDILSDKQSGSSYGKKADVYKFGLFMLSLIQGVSLSETDSGIDVPDSLPSDLCDFLNKCLCKDEERYSTNQLLEHQFFKAKTSAVRFNFEKTEAGQCDIAKIQPIDVGVIEQVGARNNQSRIDTEFEFIEYIGEGAFGAVQKYRNKLDGRFYAIKRIKLNPRNKQLNRKIVREVQLLSRLNHENVVRYYNSWIETSEVVEENSETDETQVTSDMKRNEFTFSDGIEELAPSIKVSITYDGKSQAAYENSSDSESDSSDSSENCAIPRCKESDESDVQFQRSSSDITASLIPEPENVRKVHRVDYMYIQMEFCEKSTLKTAIDDDLYKDQSRVERLFREILEGLAHIHQQGMIHRDLKPVNIFLDSKDHVKIGDFGLATTNLRNKLEVNVSETCPPVEFCESQTGHVGTPFYTAPELDEITLKSAYNEKVDIYSLGIILFEMCYKPPRTGMERAEILLALRQNGVIFPSDHAETLVEKHSEVIRWLLNHDASKRPTSLELLESKYVPPPILEEKELMDLIRHTLDNPQSKGYKYLIASCFDQNLSVAQDITYDMDHDATLFKPHEMFYELVKDITVKIFRKHGGQNLPTPLLMPKNKLYSFYSKEDNCVKLMNHGGGVVSLPYDLRVPFARYIAWNQISLFRRYSIERVYREKKIFGFIPRELYECAFDIVTPTPGNLIPDAEILCIVSEIINEIPFLKDKTIVIRLNHALLLKSLLLHYGVKLDDHERFFATFSELKDDKLNRNDFTNFLSNLSLSETQANGLYTVLNTEFEARKMASNFGMITRKNTGYSDDARRALRELKTIVDTSESLGVNFEIVLTPGLVYNTQQFSGMICQFVCEFKRRKHSKMEVLAAGGRYDSMVSHYQNLQKRNVLSKDVQQSAVGISISLDKIVQAIHKEFTTSENGAIGLGHFDVIICSIGNKTCLNEKIKIIQNFSTFGVRWTLLEAGNIKEVEELREELKVPYVIIIKDTDDETVILRTWEKERFQEKTYTFPELFDDFHKLVKKISLFPEENSCGDYKNYERTRSTNDATVEIIFHTCEKIPLSTKKRCEILISSQLNEFFKRLVGHVIVLALSIDTSILRTIAAILEFNSDETFQKSVDLILEKHTRHKKILEELCDVIYEHKSKQSKPFVILYSLIDFGHKLL